jgi:hypothetical protein
VPALLHARACRLFTSADKDEESVRSQLDEVFPTVQGLGRTDATAHVP